MDKNELRQLIAQRKSEIAQAAKFDLSGPILRRLAVHPRFSDARTVLMYHALPDEVDTRDFIRYWSLRKSILLPCVKGKEIELRHYAGDDSMEKGRFGILEPTGPAFTDYASIDLAVIPGIAFDAAGNRLGRGKGFYDRLLSRLKDYHIYKMGLCFDFQKTDHVPADAHDIPVDEVI